jgi:putative spermidine/putrescine transport system substrate-binding protein
MRHLLRRRGLALLACGSVAAVLATACGGSGGGSDSGTVIAYNAPDAWANYKAVRTAFIDDSGITVPSDTKNSGQALSAIQAEKDHPQADTGYWGITYGIQAAEDGLLQAYKPKGWDDVDPALKDAGGMWTAVHYGTVAFLVNTDALGDTPVPKSWADLLKPEYKDKVFYADPAAAAIGYFSAAAVNLAMGGTADNWKPALDYFAKLAENGAKHPVNTTPSKIASGEYAILIDADFNGYIQKYDNNAPVETVIPSDGTIRVPYTIGLVKDDPNPDGAKKWIDFLLSDKGQALFAQAFVHPVRGSIPADVQAKMRPESDYASTKDVDYTALAAQHDAFIDLFKAQVPAS